MSSKKLPQVSPDPKCVRCGQDIDPEDLKPNPLGEQTDAFMDVAEGLGLTREDLAGPMAEVSAEIYARRCDRCGSWMCHVCVNRVTWHHRRKARHRGCGGIFQPKPVR